jgi:pimeloyl-ACP methyl ester carboxylesterase
MQAKPFIIKIAQPDLDDLESRLKNTRFPDEPDAAGAGWSNGSDVTYMKELVNYWLHKYDWRKHEAAMNKLPHFKVTIDGTQIHFIHERSKKVNAPAIIMTHGWPDTFYRFHKVIPLLLEDFDVVVPSLPGFGFSERKAMNSQAIADLWAKLMTEVLGYESFLAAGGDLGSPVTKALAMQHADVVKAIHLTDVGYPTGQEDMATLTKAEQEFVNTTQWWSMTEGAYLFVQGNKPQSLAYGLNDSPAGLAAWMVSFANSGSDQPVADLAFGGRDELLTNVMIYWLTETAGSAARMYREEAKTTYGGDWNAEPAAPPKSDVPAAVAIFGGDLQFPREWAERQGLNVKRFKKIAEGGHFAALDAPDAFAKDLREAFAGLA